METNKKKSIENKLINTEIAVIFVFGFLFITLFNYIL